MRRTTLVLAAISVMGLGVVASAATVDCSTQGLSNPTGSQILFTYSQWATNPQMTSNDGCLQQDKIFSNFDPGAAPTDTVMFLRLQHDPLTGGDIHTVIFADDFNVPFTIMYSVRVNTPASQEVIWKVTGDILNTSATGSPSLNKRICDSPIPGTCAGSSFDANGTTTPGSPVIIPVPLLQRLNVTDTYTISPGAAGAEAFSNAFFQITVPEPGTTVLFGAGLLVLGFVSRRRRII